MAEATVDLMVLARTKNTFTPKGETEPVTFFQAAAFDVNAQQFVVFRSKHIDDFDKLIPGEVTRDFEVSVDKPTQIPATLMRPVSTGGGFGGEAF